MKRTKTMFSRQNRESKGISRAKLDAAVSFGVEALEGRRLLSAAVPNTPILNHFIGGSETSLSFQFTDNATNETGFRVDRQVENGPFIPFATLPANPGTGLVGYVDNTVAPDTIFRYQITALNGTTESSPSLFAAASVTPSTPYAFSVTALSPTAVQLTFYDGSNIESGFGVSELSGIGVLSVNSYTFPAHPGTGFVTETINNLNAGMKYEFTLSVATKFSSSAGATSPITITMPTIAVGGASISGTVIGNPGAEQVYLDLQGVGIYMAGDPIVTADAQGKYDFTGLNAGNYLVRVKPQAGIFTTIPIWGGKYFVPLAANQAIAGDDFTVQNLPSLPLGNQSLVYGTGSNGRNYLERFNADGTADSTFGQNLVVGQPSTDVFHAILPASATGNPTAATVQANGNIVVNYTGSLVTLSGSGAIISVTVTGITINAPTGLTAAATSPTSVRIDFTDNSTNEDTFILQRSNSATGPFSLVSSIGGFGGGGGVPLTGPVSYIDTTAQPNTTYYYRVYGFNVAAAIQSAIAGPVSVTTPVVGTGGATISGTVFGDVNGDGTQNPHSEISGVQVYLDLPGIGRFVQGDPLTTTSINGNYVFTGVKPGNYLVRPIVPSNKVITTPLFGGKYFVQLAVNQNVSGEDFGLFVIPATQFTVNGQLIVARPGLNSPTLRRFNTDSSVDIGFGTYGTVTLPPTITGTPSSIVPGVAGNLVATYPTAIVTLSSTGAILSVVPSGVAIIAPTGLTAIATSPTSVQLGFTDNSTNDNGFVIERSITVGGPFVGVGTLPGLLTGPSTGFVGFTDNTAAPNTNYYYRVYGVSGATQSAITGPVGATTPPIVTGGGSISGTVYNDANNNGVQDIGETGVPGRQVYLDLQGIGSYVSGDPIVATDAQGKYGFNGLVSSNYLIRLAPQSESVTSEPLFGGKYFVQLEQTQSVTGDNFGTVDTSSFQSITIQPDGKLLAKHGSAFFGNTQDRVFLTRYNSDGSVDTAFGALGTISRSSSFPNSVDITKITFLPNGALVVSTFVRPVHTTDIYSLNLYTYSGQLLNTVTPGFAVAGGVRGLLLRPNGKLLLYGKIGDGTSGNSGGSRLSFIQYNSDLTVDTIFVGPSNLDDAVTGITNTQDGGFDVSYKSQTVHVSSTGAIDPGILPPVATNIVATAVSPTQIAIQFTDNATNESQYIIQKKTPNYSDPAHPSWTNRGSVQGSPATGPRLFLVDDLGVNTGITDNQFRIITDTGVVQSVAVSVPNVILPGDKPNIVVLSNGKTVSSLSLPTTIGSAFMDLLVTRNNVDGMPDNMFGTGGRVKIDTDLPPAANVAKVNQILVQSDGTLLVLDYHFIQGGTSHSTVETLFVLGTDGKVIRQSIISSAVGVVGTGGPTVDKIALASDGKILAVGFYFQDYNQYPPFRYVSRFNADLTPDPTFGSPIFASNGSSTGITGTNIGNLDAPDGIAQLPDGNILIPFGSYAVLLGSTGQILPPGFNAPANLTATPLSANTVHLQFTDNSVNETGYAIERKDGANTYWSSLSYSPIRPAQDGTGVVVFDDPSTSPSTTYQYRVFAVNGSLRTGYSGPVTITTPA